MAQLVARLVRNEKVGGSNPPSSTTGRHPIRMSVFLYAWALLRCLLLCCFGAAGVPGAASALLGRAAWCARGRRPAREPSAPGLKDKKSWSEPDLSALWCEKVWFKVVGGQL